MTARAYNNIGSQCFTARPNKIAKKRREQKQRAELRNAQGEQEAHPLALEVDQIGPGAVPTPLESARGSQYGDSSNVINVDGAHNNNGSQR